MTRRADRRAAERGGSGCHCAAGPSHSCSDGRCDKCAIASLRRALRVARKKIAALQNGLNYWTLRKGARPAASRKESPCKARAWCQ